MTGKWIEVIARSQRGGKNQRVCFMKASWFTFSCSWVNLFWRMSFCSVTSHSSLRCCSLAEANKCSDDFFHSSSSSACSWDNYSTNRRRVLRVWIHLWNGFSAGTSSVANITRPVQTQHYHCWSWPFEAELGDCPVPAGCSSAAPPPPRLVVYALLAISSSFLKVPVQVKTDRTISYLGLLFLFKNTKSLVPCCTCYFDLCIQ